MSEINLHFIMSQFEVFGTSEDRFLHIDLHFIMSQFEVQAAFLMTASLSSFTFHYESIRSLRI